MTAHLLSAIEAAPKIMNYVCLTEVNQMIRFSVIFLHEGGMHAFHAALNHSCITVHKSRYLRQDMHVKVLYLLTQKYCKEISCISNKMKQNKTKKTF